jgi:predicted DNA-binding transcriptional regulator YafY
MRYARQEDLQKLALTMQGSAEGVSLSDIEREFSVSRRTAERMRDAVRNAYPQIEEISGESGRKYWRFPPGSLGRMVEPTLDELTAGHRAAAIARREGDEVTADTLERLLTKVQAMFREEPIAVAAENGGSVIIELPTLRVPKTVAPSIRRGLSVTVPDGRRFKIESIIRSGSPADDRFIICTLELAP